ncbi:putative 1-acyl-sn-glycerol-3-phosphateacyltransferase-lik e protein [Trypanosoma vivax]|uniref:Putative 1-acyl-sn-glycerol-3-phosphateacyltransferase-lik e protein n=1 Tax=Trypanosoma vivax (strain Y486) TaxID=1055687 RepID=G0U930_TRYVY|nr:putative 1-acyl-sn-glycerol-3-phosphateacyltransferase-lik e protein [Trypanosoma vivax]CCC54113.1 putative 1-acyl-sn-glycerol-3-phosphateacyltransferase-lik e protein [Trypanosoma vivax Y486]
MSGRFLVRLLASLYLFSLVFVCWIVAWLLQLLVIAVTFPFASKTQRQDWCSYIFRLHNMLPMVLLNPFWKVHTLRPFPQTREKKLIVMMNHSSAADTFLVLRVLFPRDASWVAKDILFRVPFGGWCMSNADDLCVYFKNKRKSMETVKGTVGPMMEAAHKKVARGRMIAIFPEGTRNNTPEDGLLPFRPGFFKLAIDEGATIIPIAASGTEKCWPHRSWLVDVGEAYFSCGDPVHASNFDSVEGLMNHVHKVITELRATHPSVVAEGSPQ